MNMFDLGTPQLPGEKKGIEFREVLSIVWRRKWLIFIPLVVALVGGLLLCRFLPKMYTSTAYIHFGRPEYTVENPTRAMLISHQAVFKERARRLEIEVTLREVLMKIFKEVQLVDPSRPLSLLGEVKIFLFGLEVEHGPQPAISEQYEAARQNLLVEFREDQPIIKIEYTVDNRLVARTVCDKVAERMFEREQESGKILEHQKGRYLAKYMEAEERLNGPKGIRKHIKAVVVEAQSADTMPDRLDYMGRRLENVRADIRVLGEKISRDSATYAILAILVRGLRRLLPAGPRTLEPGGDPEEILARELYDNYKEYVDRLAEAYGSGNWKVKEQRAVLRKLQREAIIQDKKIEQIPIKLPALRAERRRLDKEMSGKQASWGEKQKRQQEIEKRIQEHASAPENSSSRLTEAQLAELEGELRQIDELHLPEIRSEISALQKETVKVQKELEEFERLARLTGYMDTEIPLVPGEAGDGAAEGEGEEAASADLVREELQDPEIRKILEKLIGPRMHPNTNPEWLDAMVRLASLEVSIRRDTERVKELQAEKEDMDNRISSAFAIETRLKSMYEEEKELTARYDKALERYERAQAQEELFKRSMGLGTGGEPGDVKRFEASLPLVHSSPRFSLIMIITAVGGLVVGGALTLLVEMTDHTVKRPVDLRRVIDQPILAAIPSLDIARFHTPENLFFRTKRAVEADLESGVLYDRSYLKDIRYRSIATEQIRKLRLNMQTPDGEKVRTILVTSALAGEGKSTVAANLAVAISQMIGEHVLIIDGDLRRPDLHNFFGLPPKPGLSEYLENDLDLSQLLVKTDFDKLTLLQAGKVPANSTELLNSEKMRHLIQEVKSRYPDRYVVLDSPPVLSTSEPDVLAGQVDGLILVVRAGMTSREMVEDVLLSLNPEKVLGVVMNDVRGGASKYYSPTYA